MLLDVVWRWLFIDSGRAGYLHSPLCDTKAFSAKLPPPSFYLLLLPPTGGGGGGGGGGGSVPLAAVDYPFSRQRQESIALQD